MDNMKGRIIPFNRLANRTIQKDEELKDSFFVDVYAQAEELVTTIIGENKRKLQNSNYSQNKNYCLQSAMDVNNVIAFTGRRGTGKTSAMLAFSDALVKKTSEVNRMHSDIDFYAVPYIDASMTYIEGEDFFEIIIYRMLKLLDQIESAYDDSESLVELKDDFSKAFSHYTSLKQNKGADFLPSYSLMRKGVDKHGIREEMIELVKKYTDVIRRITGSSAQKSFLVICIDDIDMAKKNHTDIMQFIYQYFMIPRVIVMITLNLPPLSTSVKKEFYSQIDIHDDEAEMRRNLRLSQEQAQDFLRKIIPSDMRITMPSWKKMDLRDLCPIKVRFEQVDLEKGKIEGFDRLSTEFVKNLKAYMKILKDKNKGETISPKELLMMLLADRTHCYLDFMGHKYHFMEPDSLRNLYDLFYLLYNMKNVDNSDPFLKYTQLEYNRKILLNYLYFRMIPEFNMSAESKEQLEKLQHGMIDRRGREIWEYYYQCLTNKEQDIRALYGDAFVENEKNKHKIENYSFGEVFRCLYFGSRLNLFEKEYVKSVLAMYSFTLPQHVEMQKKGRKDHHQRMCSDSKNTAKLEQLVNDTESTDMLKEIRDGVQYLYRFRELRNLFGYSLLGTWRYDLFGGKKASIVINKAIFRKQMQNEANMKETIRHLVYLLSLSACSSLERYRVKKNDWTWEIDADLDPTAFIMGTIRIARIVTMEFSFEGNTCTLWGLLYQFCSEMKSSNVSEEQIKKALSEVILEFYGEKRLQAQECDQHENDVVWFLLKNTDITYNIIKRTIKQFLYSSDGNLNILESEAKLRKWPFELMQDFYNKLNVQLQRYTELYGLPSEHYDLEKHPIVEWFLPSTSKNYGKYCCIAVAEEELDEKESEKCFYRYGCGIEFVSLRGRKDNTLGSLLKELLNAAPKKEYDYLPFLFSTIRTFYKEKENVILSEEQSDKITQIVLDYTNYADISVKQLINSVDSIINKSRDNESNAVKCKTVFKEAFDETDYMAMMRILETEFESVINVETAERIKNRIFKDAPIEKIKELINSEGANTEESTEGASASPEATESSQDQSSSPPSPKDGDVK